MDRLREISENTSVTISIKTMVTIAITLCSSFGFYYKLMGEIEEAKLLSDAKALLNDEESVWKGHVLLLLGDFYFSRKEFIKAKHFYTQILSIKKLERDLYEQAKEKLIFISDD